MLILHTADWHLGDRLGRVDRTNDLRKAVERVGALCRQEKVDLLLVAGDLFSELSRPDGLRETIEHWQEVFGDFLQQGGTILTLTGNHDNENFCQTLSHAMSLAAPLSGEIGSLLPSGRLYLATEPSLIRLKDPHTHEEIQFLLMPYPTPARYLRDAAAQRYGSPEEKSRKLHEAFCEALRAIRESDRYLRNLPTILAAHVNVYGAQIGNGLFRLAEQDDVVVNANELFADFTYVALGHVHKPQFLMEKTNIRYSGSIERMDLGEHLDSKSVVIFEVGPDGLKAEPRLLPLPSTPIYEIDILNPTEEIPKLRERYPDAKDDLVNIHFTYTAGVDNLEQILKELDEIFPRWYHRDWRESSALGPSLATEPGHGKSFQETVRDYVSQELMNYTDEERNAIFERLEVLFREEE